jgi:hypothetical protein
MGPWGCRGSCEGPEGHGEGPVEAVRYSLPMEEPTPGFSMEPLTMEDAGCE